MSNKKEFERLNGQELAAHLASGRGSVRQAVKWTAVSNVTNGLINSLITVILAALLGPKEYGIVAIAILLISLLEIIPGFGLETALIQHSRLDQNNLTSVFWANVFLGLIFNCLTILISGWWGTINGSTQLTKVTIALSMLIPLHSLSIVQTAFLKKMLNFKSLAIRDVSATIASGAIGIGSALVGMGVWSLVFQHLTRGAVSCLLLWLASPWRPSMNFTWEGLKPLLNFALKTFVGQLGVFFQNNIDSLVMGILFGPTAVGLYRFCSRIIEMILTFFPRAIQVVALPHFSRLQEDRKELRESFLKGSHVSCLVTIPLFAVLAGAPKLFLGLIGDKWLPASLTLSLLTMVGLGKSILLLVGPLLQAISRPGINSFNTWAFATVNAAGVLVVANLVRAVPPGDQAASIALMRVFIFYLLFVPLLLWQTKRFVGVSFNRILETLRGTLTAGLGTAATIAFLERVDFFSIILNKPIKFVLVVGTLVLVWFGLLHLFDRIGFQLIWLEGSRLWNKLAKPIRQWNL